MIYRGTIFLGACFCREFAAPPAYMDGTRLLYNICSVIVHARTYPSTDLPPRHHRFQLHLQIFCCVPLFHILCGQYMGLHLPLLVYIVTCYCHIRCRGQGCPAVGCQCDIHGLVEQAFNFGRAILVKLYYPRSNCFPAGHCVIWLKKTDELFKSFILHHWHRLHVEGHHFTN